MTSTLDLSDEAKYIRNIRTNNIKYIIPGFVFCIGDYDVQVRKTIHLDSIISLQYKQRLGDFKGTIVNLKNNDGYVIFDKHFINLDIIYHVLEQYKQQINKIFIPHTTSIIMEYISDINIG